MEKLRLSTITNISASHEMCNELRGGRRERNANSDTLSSLSAVVNPGARRDSTRWFFFFFPLHEQYTPWRRQVEMDTATIRSKRWKKDGARAGKGWQTNVISRGGDSAGCLHAKYESVAHLHRFI